MKNLKVLLFAVALVATTSLFATPVVPDIPAKLIGVQVTDLFSEPDFKLDQETVVDITFTFSSEGDIIILNIDSNDREIRNYIAKTMNHKMIQTPGEANRVFTLPLRINKQ
ncbi:hypothetical protein EC396_03625 [Lutibacter sp. HS1-25]|uniref:hypothetical protein n=1 Tax=Lutibacter sp. HS1-25 TaxID=2485000 RepID=UPI001011525B|nr:hypothetical protein [Lutibacter sp. HS1-25]RXP61909.1 hypothetical protein EC396_03625 [Lutibacter sp. HS1-25]